MSGHVGLGRPLGGGASSSPGERTVSGGHGGGETPVPIPNTAVKPASADGTWGVAPWESRTPPGFLQTMPPPMRGHRRVRGPWFRPGVRTRRCSGRGDVIEIDRTRVGSLDAEHQEVGAGRTPSATLQPMCCTVSVASPTAGCRVERWTVRLEAAGGVGDRHGVGDAGPVHRHCHGHAAPLDIESGDVAHAGVAAERVLEPADPPRPRPRPDTGPGRAAPPTEDRGVRCQGHLVVGIDPRSCGPRGRGPRRPVSRARSRSRSTWSGWRGRLGG